MKTIRTAVLGSVNFAHAAELLSGVSNYSNTKRNLEIIPLHYSQEGTLEQLIRKGRIDGLIGEIISDKWIASMPAKRRIPIINTSGLSRLTSISSVIADDRAIGKLAAEHFIRRSYPTLFYAGIRSYACNGERLAGFSDTAAEHKLKVTPLPRANITASLNCWIEILKKALKPIGILCIDDHTARRLITACRKAKLKIPDNISIIGVGNTQLDSFFAGIGISSIDIPYATIGYEAARLLDCRLKDSTKTHQLIKIAPQGIALRETTGTGALNTLTGRAINYIEANLAKPITVTDIAKHTNASRRLLEIRFQQNIGRSPHAELTHLRMIKARQLLLNKNTKIADIAIQCGYPEISHFYAAFKRHNNNPPAKWRKHPTP